MKIELIGVGKRYGAHVALDRVDLEIEHGARVGLIGPNGSGKSTLLRIVMGLVTHEGTVRLDGMSPFAERVRVAEKLAYVPQIAPQLGATLGEITRVISELRDCSPRAIADVASRLKLDVEAIRDRPFRALSGGMKQKALIAMAFATKASLIILDEPTASLDAAARETFSDLVDEVRGRATVILCSHRGDDVHRLVSRVIELGEGRIVRDVEAIRGERGRQSDASSAGRRTT